MGLLQKFEDSIDRVVNGAFAKAFKAEVQPVELAAALQREVDDRASVLDRDRTVIPNVFHIELSHHDYTRLAVFKDALGNELATLVTNYAGEQHYTLLGQTRVTMSEDDTLETGIFRVRSEAKAEVTSKSRAQRALVLPRPVAANRGWRSGVRRIHSCGRSPFSAEGPMRTSASRTPVFRASTARSSSAPPHSCAI